MPVDTGLAVGIARTLGGRTDCRLFFIHPGGLQGEATIFRVSLDQLINVALARWMNGMMRARS